MPKRPLQQLHAENFRSLHKVDVELQPLTVLVGPNGAGKSNLLSVIRFLGETARLDLDFAISRFGGFDRLCFRGTEARLRSFTVGVKANVTKFAHEGVPDEYRLRVNETKPRSPGRLSRNEEFRFKRTAKQGRRITVRGQGFSVVDEESQTKQRSAKLSTTSTALSTLPRLGPGEGGEQLRQLAELFLNFRVFEIDVDAARAPARIDDAHPRLAADASNVAAYVLSLKRDQPEVFTRLEQDLRRVVPGLKGLEIRSAGGAVAAAELAFLECGLPGSTALADASFGTVRALALLAMLHDPDPPQLTCVEEIDHGLHPHALDVIVERMREATERTQLLVATHSPTLVNRLRPEELVVCERDEATGASLIPAISPQVVRAMVEESELGLGELWFTGSLGGGLP